MDGPGSNPGGDEIFRPSRPSWGSPSLLYNGYRVFPGGRVGRGVGLTPQPLLECRGPRKSRAIPPLTLRACVAYKRVKTCLLQWIFLVEIWFSLCRKWELGETPFWYNRFRPLVGNFSNQRPVRPAGSSHGIFNRWNGTGTSFSRHISLWPC